MAVALLGFAIPASAAPPPAPAWQLTASSQPTNLVPGGINQEYVLVATNIGGADATGFSLSDVLPTGVTATEAEYVFGGGGATGEGSCVLAVGTVTCSSSGTIHPGEKIDVSIFLEVTAPDTSTLVNRASIAGGGAKSVSATMDIPVSSAPSPFTFLDGDDGLSMFLTTADGRAAAQAGSHPYQLTLNMGLSTIDAGEPPSAGFSRFFGSDGGVRDLSTALPRGLVVNPNATPSRCTEAQLEADSCSDETQVGLITIFTTPLGGNHFSSTQVPLFNMVPPPGTPAEFGFDAVGATIYVHIEGGVRAEDYALTADARDILARSFNPIAGIQVQLWGDPRAANHDFVRGACGERSEGSCAGGSSLAPLLTMPTACSSSMQIDVSADSWDHPDRTIFRHATVADAGGAPIRVTGCKSLDFSPHIDLRPSSQEADSPSGINVDLSLPQTSDVQTNAEANLKKAVVQLPVGMTLNPSAADGLEGCTEAEIGVSKEGPPISFTGDDPICPAASKVGSGSIDTPLLPEPLDVDLYLADPNDNPFHSLLSGYLVAHGSGVTIKLAAKFDRDPDTGQLTATVDDNPQLPFSDLKLHFKGGDRGVLVNPRECGTYTINSYLVPWSAADPDNPTPAEIVHESNSFDVTSGPAGGPCPGSAQFDPGFEAGTVTPIAGAYSPFVLKLSREDGSQRFGQIDTTLPEGLLAKLAGVAECSDTALAAAEGKSGAAEKANSSCPAASEVGIVNVGAGSGSPFYVQGHAYLAGPYKGAPLSLVVVTPAVAGPFDLGNVVIRTALYVNEATAQIHAVSDPIPSILQGIPLDVRSIGLQLDRSDFTLNPTSCAAKQIIGTSISTLGRSASLQNRFQVGACNALTFGPHLSLRLKGSTKRSGHPALRAVLAFPAGDNANIARASVALPHSEFLDQAHIRTICTRVQFAAEQCPEGSIYGRARAFTPLLDKPLEGPVYLRSSSHPLPDLVADLRGRIHVVLDGRIDSVKGGIRTTFEAVPDAPVSKFVLEMQGAKKGLLVNSRNICQEVNRATVLLDAQNSKTADSHPALKADCRKKRKAHKPHHKGASRRR